MENFRIPYPDEFFNRLVHRVLDMRPAVLTDRIKKLWEFEGRIFLETVGEMSRGVGIPQFTIKKLDHLSGKNLPRLTPKMKAVLDHLEKFPKDRLLTNRELANKLDITHPTVAKALEAEKYQ
jgi:hypothetical protein